jgi:hypothetical protein
MSFDTVSTTLSSAVADNGTFTVSYPANRGAGDYTGAHAHSMRAMMTNFYAPVDFTASFGASSVTITYKGSTTIPVGETVYLQFDRLGDDDRAPYSEPIPANMVRAPLYRIDLGTPDTADSDGICASQSVTIATTPLAVLDGAYLSGEEAVLDVARNVVAAWTGTAIVTITGTDIEGDAVVEVSASGTSHTGAKAFKTVTSVSFSANVTSATVGTGTKLGLPRYVYDANQVLAEYADGVVLPRRAGKMSIPWELEQTELLAPTAEQIVSPVAGWITGVRGIIQGAVTTGGAVTVEIATVAVLGLTFTVADAATAGTVYNDAPTTRHHSTTLLAAGDAITITPASAFATAGSINGSLDIEVSAAGQLDGTFVAGVTTVASGTTGDTRGTYTPSITPDGAVSYSLLVVYPAPGDQGVPQYVG